jgi:hypothetical protein
MLSNRTFEEREDSRWLRWWHRKAAPIVRARAKRRERASGSISSWLRPVCVAHPLKETPSREPIAAILEREAERHLVRVRRDDEIAQLIADQAYDALQATPTGYLLVDSELTEKGLSPSGELEDEQEWHAHIILSDPRSWGSSSKQSRARLGFVAWDAEQE